MKAAVFKEAGTPLRIEEVPDPTPGPDEVVIKVGRCGICGTDLHRTEGHEGYTWPSGFVLGHEFAGEVVALGSKVEQIRLGDRVTALPYTGCGTCEPCLAGNPYFCSNGLRPMMGGFAEYTRVGWREAVKLPAALSLADGALVEPLAVGLRAVQLATLTPGARVLVIGAGPIGLATIFWAKRQGAGTIVATASSLRREGLALEMGATKLFAASEDPTEEIIRTLGGMPDVVFEAVGLPGMIAQAIAQVRPAGTVVVMGLCIGPDTIIPSLALRKGLRLLFSNAYNVSIFRQAVDTREAGHVEPRAMITDTVSLEGFPAAFEALRRRSTQCKVMLDPWRG